METFFDAHTDGETVRLKILRARLDAGGSPQFKEQIGALWKDSFVHAEIEMTNVDFIDSSGVGFLLSILRRFPEDTGKVVLKGLKPQVQAVIELLRLHRIFQLEA
jgi:anti-sigma B factor antagonist